MISPFLEGMTELPSMAACNVIWAMHPAAPTDDVTELTVLQGLPDSSRVILVRISDIPTLPIQHHLDSFIDSGFQPGSQPIGREYISLDVIGNDPDLAWSALQSLLMPDLPTVLIWDSTLPPDHPLLIAVGSRMDRIITNLFPPCDSAASWNGFFRLLDALDGTPLITDMTESLIQSWQTSIAALFDQHPRAAENLREIHLHYESPHIPADILFLAAWLTTVLEWTHEEYSRNKKLAALKFPEERAIIFHGRSEASDDYWIEFVVSDKAGASHLICREPSTDNRIIELIKNRLRMGSSDRRRDLTLECCRRWLKDIPLT